MLSFTCRAQMAAVQKPAAGKPGVEEEAAPVHRIRITLTSRNVANLEKGAPSTPRCHELCYHFATLVSETQCPGSALLYVLRGCSSAPRPPGPRSLDVADVLLMASPQSIARLPSWSSRETKPPVVSWGYRTPLTVVHP